MLRLPRLRTVTFRGSDHAVESLYEDDHYFAWWFADLDETEQEALRVTADEDGDIQDQLFRQQTEDALEARKLEAM